MRTSGFLDWRKGGWGLTSLLSTASRGFYSSFSLLLMKIIIVIFFTNIITFYFFSIINLFFSHFIGFIFFFSWCRHTQGVSEWVSGFAVFLLLARDKQWQERCGEGSADLFSVYPGIGCMGMVQNCARRGLDWTLGGISKRVVKCWNRLLPQACQCLGGIWTMPLVI